MSKYFLNCLVNSQDCLLKKSGIFDVTGAALCSLEELQLKIVFNIKSVRQLIVESYSQVVKY